MRLIRFAISLALFLALNDLGPSSASAANCQFVLGFKALHDLIPATVGDCLVDEHHNPANGDGLQETAGPTGAGGLLVWRRADNWTAFTDGSRTWINGPFGLESRFNSQRFQWEPDVSSHQGVGENIKEATVCAGLPGTATGPVAAACFSMWAENITRNQFPAVSAPAYSTLPSASSLGLVGSVETVSVADTSNDGSTVLVRRNDGTIWLLGFAGGCPGIDSSMNSSVIVVSPGGRLGSGTTIILPSTGDRCDIAFGYRD